MHHVVRGAGGQKIRRESAGVQFPVVGLVAGVLVLSMVFCNRFDARFSPGGSARPTVSGLGVDRRVASGTPYRVTPTPSVGVPVATRPFTATPGVAGAGRERRVTVVATKSVVEVTPVSTIEVVTPVPINEPGFDLFVASYYPDSGDLWCLDYAGGLCLSSMTSGDDWRDYVGRAAACPVEWLGRSFEVAGLGVYICLDTGEGARCQDGLCSVYVLSDEYVLGLYTAFWRDE